MPLDGSGVLEEEEENHDEDEEELGVEEVAVVDVDGVGEGAA